MFSKSRKKLAPVPKQRKLYVVRDTVAEDVGPVWDSVNDQVALRNFRVVLKRVDYPADFELVCIGVLEPDLTVIACNRVVEFDYDSFSESFVVDEVVPDEKRI